MDRHFRNLQPVRYHDNGFPRQVNRPGMTLSEVREYIRGRRHQRDDDHHDDEQVRD